MGNLYLARHCKTAWNLEHRIQGRTDIPLCEIGIEEAKMNVGFLEALKISKIYSSPLTRGRQTATIYATALEVPYETRDGLLEMDMGEWEGKTALELSALKPSLYLQWIEDPRNVPLVPGSKEDVFTAQRRILSTILAIYKENDEEKNVLVIIHKYICSLLRCALQGLELNHFKKEIIETTLPQNLSIVSSQVIEKCLSNC
ncbi:histidine phosphatase family protein [Candidatus Methylacidiphilum fumarolicum]|uniref:Phosphoglycerate mutase, PhoE family n=2 Tax=Candidatus Methylacidiphilum fumarolicum TaxID=591154 RepID=I0JYX1_METFB|nr:histidine phosphatase family protein [Candidatus Methylacidiphilum fumarolicum]MBW6415953.1 histidine phosphatase family protein [Candidatus Methylacidiphilum fumarolicum]TFE68885.1 phosphoglycerate mutase [Candidatus Methylacidiphilum fumarolicum]TFE71507.1 histidine phosphatase family protein [Candidatus Methylacidiphilum fumarolicum]TFE71593.1 histidine phosphatase family protein [Candidatus Methylacidiphilum fumarolicum]TFE76228.1 phosphoglycerate mutase [Candidatus Methylacidiphilum fu